MRVYHHSQFAVWMHQNISSTREQGNSGPTLPLDSWSHAHACNHTTREQGAMCMHAPGLKEMDLTSIPHGYLECEKTGLLWITMLLYSFSFKQHHWLFETDSIQWICTEHLLCIDEKCSLAVPLSLSWVVHCANKWLVVPKAPLLQEPSGEPGLNWRLLLSYQQLHLFCALWISCNFLKAAAHSFSTWKSGSVGEQLVKERNQVVSGRGSNPSMVEISPPLKWRG